MSTDNVDLSPLFERACQLIEGDAKITEQVWAAFQKDHVFRFDFSGTGEPALMTRARSKFTSPELREAPKRELPGDLPGWIAVCVGNRGQIFPYLFKDRAGMASTIFPRDSELLDAEPPADHGLPYWMIAPEVQESLPAVPVGSVFFLERTRKPVKRADGGWDEGFTKMRDATVSEVLSLLPSAALSAEHQTVLGPWSTVDERACRRLVALDCDGRVYAARVELPVPS